MRAGSGISTRLDPRQAVAEATAMALRSGALEAPEFALVLATSAYGDGLPAIAECSIGLLPSATVLGVSVEGVMGNGLEVLNNPAVSVLLLEGYAVEPFLLRDLGHDPEGAGPELSARFGGLLGSDDVVVVLPDPICIHPDTLLGSLREYLEPARVVGGAAGSVASGGSFAWLGDLQAPSGLPGFVLRSSHDADVGVTQACHRVTSPLRVTRSRGNWIYGLDGKPALDVYREAARGPLAEDLERASRFLMVAIPPDDAHDAHDAKIVNVPVRHVVGFDSERGAFSLPQPVASGRLVWFALLDSGAAREDLGRTLKDRLHDPGFGLYFNCRARGEALFGVSGLEAGYIERHYAKVPIVGSFGAFQIAPPPDRSGDPSASQLLTYAGVLALFPGMKSAPSG